MGSIGHAYPSTKSFSFITPFYHRGVLDFWPAFNRRLRLKSTRIRSYTKMSREGSCSVEECGRKILARKLCAGHYGQVSQYGKIQTKIIREWGYAKRNADNHKLCYRCDIYMPESSFPKSKKMGDGLSKYCKICTIASNHGITRSMFDEIIIRQSGLCEICDEQLIRPNIDHDHNCCSGTHSCGYCIRGIICRNCNSSIGLAKDSPDILIRMANYLESNQK